jgi:hypothetical protein
MSRVKVGVIRVAIARSKPRARRAEGQEAFFTQGRSLHNRQKLKKRKAWIRSIGRSQTSRGCHQFLKAPHDLLAQVPAVAFTVRSAGLSGTGKTEVAGWLPIHGCSTVLLNAWV